MNCMNSPNYSTISEYSKQPLNFEHILSREYFYCHAPDAYQKYQEFMTGCGKEEK